MIRKNWNYRICLSMIACLMFQAGCITSGIGDHRVKPNDGASVPIHSNRMADETSGTGTGDAGESLSAEQLVAADQEIRQASVELPAVIDAKEAGSRRAAIIASTLEEESPLIIQPDSVRIAQQNVDSPATNGSLDEIIQNELAANESSDNANMELIGEISSAADTYAPYGPGLAPRTVDDELPEEFWMLSLDEAIEYGLKHTTILRSLGGQVLQNPQVAASVFEPALRTSDPILGTEAALSAFDAQLQSSATYQNNDQVFNNPVVQGGQNEIQQDLFNLNLQLQKTAANGAVFSLNRTLQHDNNNAPPGANLFNNAWNTSLEATIRQPLLQGAGVEFNRIAGPNGQPGFRFTNGIVIAQIDSRISVAEFEAAVRTYLDQVVSSYWQLYLAYRNYEAALRARETAYDTWRIVEARYSSDLEGGEADREAQAREQLLAFGQQVLIALSGDQRSGATGVYQAEANLRRLLGLSARDEEFIKPSDSPSEAKTTYDWQHLTSIASAQRAELKQQRLRVQQSEMELLASKSFLLPRLDAIATYRFNGFGDDLMGGGPGRFSDAFKDFYSGDHQESEVGLQLTVPIGFRRQYAGYRNAQLTLQRNRAILAEQHEQIYYDLGTAVRQAALDYQAMRNAYNRLVAADQAVDARFVAFEADKIPMDFLLEAQERRARAEYSYHQSVVSYELSQVQVDSQAGNLLERFGVDFNPHN